MTTAADILKQACADSRDRARARQDAEADIAIAAIPQMYCVQVDGPNGMAVATDLTYDAACTLAANLSGMGAVVRELGTRPGQVQVER